MKVVAAIDSFKGSLSSIEAGNAAKEGVLRVFPQAEVVVSPLADGGEGTVEALCYALNGEKVIKTVTGPNGKNVSASYGIIGETAVIEMAEASGITLVSGEEKNPMHTTTFGFGELIKDAISKGCRDFIIGIGGSATNDGGIGMLAALGFEFLDKNGKAVSYGAKGVGEIEYIKNDKVLTELSECTFTVACDVTNPLCGENGCSAVYGPQKGAKKEDIAVMDEYLHRYALLTKKLYPDADENKQGAGAAGGLGFAISSYLGGALKSGIDIVLNAINLEEKIKDADLVFTGEGRMDFQTAMGKAPGGVAKLAKKYNKSVIAFAGAVKEDARECNEKGIDAFFPVLREVCSLDEAMNKENAYKNMADTVEQVMRAVKIKL